MSWTSKFSNLAIFFISILIIFTVAEVLARVFVDFDSYYYSAPKNPKPNTVTKRPYGDIPTNKFGLYDGDFNLLSDKKRIAYFGDSVTYGVGAGYPYRFTEYLDSFNPEFEHINLSGGLGASINGWSNKQYDLIEKLNIKAVVYALNLNDIAPMNASYLKTSGIKANNENSIDPVVTVLKKIISIPDMYLRGNSVAYTYIRFLIKNILIIRFGHDGGGYKAIELDPLNHNQEIKNAAEVIKSWAKNTKNKGFIPCIALLPYEMQISNDAAKAYKKIGIKFSREFEEFTTQKSLVSYINDDVETIIIGSSFPEAPVGSYFVYNKGDKIDFNHPNRKGHKLIARELADARLCNY